MKTRRKRHYLDISEGTNIVFNIFLVILSILAVIPFIFVVIISFSDETSTVSKGYSFVPERWSTYAYEYILENRSDISPFLWYITYSHCNWNTYWFGSYSYLCICYFSSHISIWKFLLC